MARREYVSFLGERSRDITFTARGRDPARWVLLLVALVAIALSVWWFGFRDADDVVATERVLAETTVPTLLQPSALEGSGLDQADVPLECGHLVEEWTMFQGGAERNGCLATLQVANPKILWSQEIGISGWRNNPVIEDGAVFVGSAGVVQFTRDRRDGIYSLDLRTGAQRWRYNTELDVNSVAVSDGILVAVGDEGRVWALQARDGTLLWQDDLEVGVFGDPLFVGGLVVVTDGNGMITAYNVANGNRAWQIAVTGAIRGGASSDGEHIFVASELGEVIALNTSGQTAWRQQLVPRSGELVGVFAAPTVVGDVIVLSVVRPDAFAEPALRALEIETGEQKWASEDTAAVKGDLWANIRSSPAIAGEYVVFGEAFSDMLVVADLTTGKTLWSVSVGGNCFPHWPSPVINSGLADEDSTIAYLARHDGGLYAVDLQSREPLWQLYLGDAEGTGAFPPEAAESGFCNWGPEDGNSVLASPAVASNGVIVVGTLEGYVMAVGDADWES